VRSRSPTPSRTLAQQGFSRAQEATGLSNATTLLFGLSGVTVQRVAGASDGSRRPTARVRLASTCSSSRRSSNRSAYPKKRLFLGTGSRSSVPPVVAPIRCNGAQRSASGRSFSLTPQAKPRFWPDSRSTNTGGADGSSPLPDTLFVQVRGLRRCFWCTHGCHPRRPSGQTRSLAGTSTCWSPPGPPLVVARWRQRHLQSLTRSRR